MGELYRHAGFGQLSAEDGFGPRLFLEWHDVFGELLLLGVIGHVEQPEAHLSQTTVADEEIAAFHDAFYQFVGNGLARLIVESKRAQKVFLHGIVFHELRGQLHKVPPHIGA